MAFKKVTKEAEVITTAFLSYSFSSDGIYRKMKESVKKMKEFIK